MLHRGIALTTVGFGVFVWRFCRNAQVGQMLKLLDEERKQEEDENITRRINRRSNGSPLAHKEARVLRWCNIGGSNVFVYPYWQQRSFLAAVSLELILIVVMPILAVLLKLRES